jgi:hypothetical protein
MKIKEDVFTATFTPQLLGVANVIHLNNIV